MAIRGISEADRNRLEADINNRYDEQQEVAKELYRIENGYKIAWNWKNQPEYNRIERNRRQALYRLGRSFDVSYLEDLLFYNTTVFDDFGDLYSGPYWNTGGADVLSYYEVAKGAGFRAVVGVDIGGSLRPYHDEYQTTRAVRSAIRQCREWQKKDEDSDRPIAEIRFGKVDRFNAVYILITFQR